MSDQIKHECGIAMIRLLKPLEYYLSKYGTSFYGLDKLYLLMEKQHNRGQDGAGIASIKMDLKPGLNYINRERSNSGAPIKDVFSNVYKEYEQIAEPNRKRLSDVNWLKENAPFVSELFLGHVRYGTFGKNDINTVHPFIRHNNWKTKSVVLAGNFNMTNVDELFNNLVQLGQHPTETTDTITILEKIGHWLDEENEELFRKYKDEGLSKMDISPKIAENMNLLNILERSAKNWDGGYVIGGMLGHGDGFVMRDPAGIRPAFYFKNDEVVVVSSERPQIQTAFNVPFDLIHELKPGNAIIIKKDGQVDIQEFKKPIERKSCSFERIYFSRGTDAVIYNERKALGKKLAPSILKSINNDLENTVFSYIPNTASVAFRGLAEELDDYCNQVRKERILEMGEHLNKINLEEVFRIKPRIEKVAVKDVKMRTFITQDNQRDDLVAHVYDITYGTVVPEQDTLVVLDDSIVRGTTLKQSILRILDRLKPRKIVIASSAPQIRYPDCYGIDMAKMGDFIAFKATIELLKEKNMENVITEVYNKCKAQEELPKEEIVNHVKEIYKPLTAEEISAKIAELLTPSDIDAKVEIIYQSIESLHEACPNDKGDWYFTGDYPTPGGNKVVNKAFINYIEGRDVRAY